MAPNRSLALPALLTLLTVALAPCPAQSPPPAESGGAGIPALWSQWRGPDRTGHAPGPIWPERLTSDNLQQRWRVELGPSYSGPIVDRERVFTTETVDGQREVVRAFDRRTGEEIWRTEWQSAMQVPFYAARNGSWIRSTPAHDGESLFVAGMRDVLVCLATDTGEERWRVDFTKRFNAPIEDFGFVCSPLLRGDHVYVQTGAGFVKLDKRSGETVWRTLGAEGGAMKSGAFSSPTFASLRGRDQLLVQGRMELYGIDDDSGDVLWSVPIRTFRGMNILTPVPYGDGVFTSAYGGRAHFFGLEEQDGQLSVSEKWQNRAQGYMTSPVVIDDHAYLYLRSKRFACVDLKSGEVAWISGSIGDEYWSLVAQGQQILALTESGELLLIAANPEEYTPIDSVEIANSETWAHLAVDGGRIFVRELDGLTAYTWGAQAMTSSVSGNGR